MDFQACPMTFPFVRGDPNHIATLYLFSHLERQGQRQRSASSALILSVVQLQRLAGLKAGSGAGQGLGESFEVRSCWKV